MRAAQGLQVEILVVDNDSGDDTVTVLQQKFPAARFLANTTNLGFAKANNQALAVAKGEYVLFLNPDTLLPPDALQKCLAYFKQHPEAGAMGVPMVDGRGIFLPESKRSLPSPWISFCKLSGLSVLFPRSTVFNRYALGFLSPYQDHSVEVLAGAFLLAQKKLLDQLNGFDENYFLYGEDIDLSYRIIRAGYQNHYYAGTAIIHFKGESSAGDQWKKLRHFYKAMAIFVSKHYPGGSGKVFNALLKTAIFFRGLLAAISAFCKPFILPVADAVWMILSLKTAAWLWVENIRDGKTFGVDAIPVLMILFAFSFITGGAAGGLYHPVQRFSRNILACMLGGIFVLAVYALLPESLRFSRGVVLMGTAAGACCVLLSRIVWDRKKRMPAADEKWLAVASEENYEAIRVLLQADSRDENLAGRVSVNEKQGNALCAFENLPGFVQQHKITHLVYCHDDTDWGKMLQQMSLLKKNKPCFLFYTKGSEALISSQVQYPGMPLVTHIAVFSLSDSYQQQLKRLLDIKLAFFSILLLPLHWVLHPFPLRFLRHAFSVLKGDKTWIGYAGTENLLPNIKPAILSSAGTVPVDGVPETAFQKTDKQYARHYEWWIDFRLFFRYYRKF